ncbi:hypothetical protein MCAP1_000499 [Malassezia caprae]|uniref:Cep57 centrosome microtubule-binding domain-containing protein n=1 Tax=Malassezia caprae TaxID=1381934 RepID=A0AAF0E3U5_9BASI|nr:hypothetical protein MCAP1_000499 [Malassezia caprae]
MPLGDDLDIPASEEEALRRNIEKELDRHLQAPSRVPSSSFLSPYASRGVRPVSSTLRSSARRSDYVWPLDSSDGSDDEDAGLMRSPGNHRALLATPNRRAPRPAKLHARPTLREPLHSRLNISHMAGLGEVSADTTARPSSPRASLPGVYARIPSPLQRRSPSLGSRHSSAETMVNSDDNEALYKAQRTRATYAEPPSALPEHLQWAHTQLHALSACIQSMEKDMERMRSSAQPMDDVHARLDALESQVADQGRQLTRLCRQLRDADERPHPPTPSARSSPPRRAPQSDTPWAAHLRRLHDELERLSQAVESLHAAGVASHEGADDSVAPDTTHERYEHICRLVADALSMAPKAHGTRKAKIHASLRQREADDAAREALLRRLSHTPAPASLTSAEVRMLERLFEQHRAEFLHQKALYCELADELKDMEPTMNKTQRRILASHVHESIDALEAEATRVNELHAHLARYSRSTL